MTVSKRQRRLAAQKEFNKPVSQFTKIDLNDASFVPKGMTRAYRNTRYTIMVYDNTIVSNGEAIKILIQKHDDSPIINHWSEIQKIKNEIFGKEVTAIEYYPAESELINDHNIYWIWIYPENKIPKPIFQ